MGKKILVVDDEPNIVEMLQVRLEAQGYEVAKAYEGQEGLEKVLKEKPDLIVLDVTMPKMNGYQVCRKIKGDEKTKGIPVIMFTAKSQESDKFWGAECGADAYIAKPFESEVVLKTIEGLLK